MLINFKILCYYLYSLIVIIVFIRNCFDRNWSFLRVTLLYYFFITFFVCLLVYSSAYSLEMHLDQLQKQGLLAQFPFTISGGRPDINTVSRTNPNYFLWSITLISFFVTFPQAVVRAARLGWLRKSQSPEIIIQETLKKYDKVRKILIYLGIIVLPTVNDFYIMGEWIFILVTISSLVSPFHPYNWYLMLLSCYFILLLTGADITRGVENTFSGPLTKILLSLAPDIINKLRSFSVAVLAMTIFIVCIAIAFFSNIVVLNIIIAVFHTKSPGVIAWIVSLVVFFGILQISYTNLSKAMELIINNLVKWMYTERSTR